MLQVLQVLGYDEVLRVLRVVRKWRIRSIQGLQISEIRNFGTAAECVHLIGDLLREVSALSSGRRPFGRGTF